jgi:hypothetical protein
MSGPDLIIERTGPPNAPNDFVGTIFQGSAANILSFSYVGSNDNETLTVSDAGGLMNFASTVPGVPNNPNLAGQAEFLYNGNGGTDNLVFNLTGASATQSYAIGSGSGSPSQEGELATVSGGVTLMSYFMNVESTQRTGTGATPGALNIIGDSGVNTFATTASGANTVVSAVGYTPFQFSGNNFNALNIDAGIGADSLTLSSLGTGQTNPLATTLSGGADADTLRVESTSGNTGVVTLLGGAGNDDFQLYSSTNTVDGIVGQVIVDGTDGNVAANNDTLTIIDSGDLTADNVIIGAVNPTVSADYRVEGITSTAGDDVTLRNIDTLIYTSTSGNDTLDTRLVNTVPPHDLTSVTVNGWLGADQFLLFTSDQAGGITPTPTGTPSGVANVSLNGDAPGNPNGADGNDIFGQTPPGLTGTGSNDVGLAIPDTVRGIRPSVSTGITINGGTPTGSPAPTSDTVGDVFNLDLSGLPGTTSLILPTASGILSPSGFQTMNYAEIEDLNLAINNQLVNVQMGDTFVRGTNGQDTILFSRLGSPNGVRVSINGGTTDLVLTGKSVIYAGASGDIVNFTNVNRSAEIYGEGGDDYISGGTSNDYLAGGLGNDQINGSGGDNIIWGDNAPVVPADPTPQDSAIGGDDILSGLGGNDVFYGGGGNDVVSAGGGNDYAYGGQGDDTLGGHDGDDRLYGGLGNDIISGGSGNDLISGGGDADELKGETGNDVLIGGGGADRINGGTGNDLLISGSVANEASIFTSVASTSSFGAQTYSNPSDNDAALLSLMTLWGTSSDRSLLAPISHDAVNDELVGDIGDDDFCWETIDILDETPALNPSDFNGPGMGLDERFGPT